MSICLKSGFMSQHLSPRPAWFKPAWDRSWQWFQMFTLQISESDWGNLRTWRWKQPGSEHAGRLGHDKISHGRAHNNYGNQGRDKFGQFVRKKEKNRWNLEHTVLPRCSLPLFPRSMATSSTHQAAKSQPLWIRASNHNQKPQRFLIVKRQIAIDFCKNHNFNDTFTLC